MAFRRESEMVKVSIEVRSGAARFRVGVQAESIERAVNLVEKRFPGRNVKVSFPIDPEVFFGECSAAQTFQQLAA
jgi:hypothetical protein